MNRREVLLGAGALLVAPSLPRVEALAPKTISQYPIILGWDLSTSPDWSCLITARYNLIKDIYEITGIGDIDVRLTDTILNRSIDIHQGEGRTRRDRHRDAGEPEAVPHGEREGRLDETADGEAEGGGVTHFQVGA